MAGWVDSPVLCLDCGKEHRFSLMGCPPKPRCAGEAAFLAWVRPPPSAGDWLRLSPAARKGWERVVEAVLEFERNQSRLRNDPAVD